MGFFKFIGKFFGGTLIFLGLVIIFTGIFLNSGMNNIGMISESADKNIPIILQENKDLITESVFKDQEISKADVERSCRMEPDQFPKEFCNKVKTLSTQEEIKDEIANLMISKLNDELTPQLKDVETKLEEQIGGTTEQLQYTTPIGITIFIIGSLLIFLSERFKWKQALFAISLKTGVISAITAASNFYMMNLSPEKFEEIAKLAPAISGQQVPEIALKLISSILMDWFKASSAEVFLVSFIVAIASLSIAIITFFLKRKKVKEKIKEPLKPKKKPKKKSKKSNKVIK